MQNEKCCYALGPALSRVLKMSRGWEIGTSRLRLVNRSYASARVDAYGDLEHVAANTFKRYRPAALVAACAMAATSAGCGLGSFTSGLGGGMLGGGSSASVPQSVAVNEEQLLNAAKSELGTGSLSEVAKNCPRLSVMQRDHSVTIYEPGRAGDGLAVMHRGELTKTARECTVEGSRVTVKYGFSGRVLLGPKGRSGNVVLPVVVQVTDAKRERLRQDSAKIETSVSVDKPIGYFSAVRTVTFDIPEGSRPGEFDIMVGFDRNVPGAG